MGELCASVQCSSAPGGNCKQWTNTNLASCAWRAWVRRIRARLGELAAEELGVAKVAHGQAARCDGIG